MNNLKLNDTPVRTSRNFNINNIKLMDVDIPEIIDDFNNLEIIGEESQVQNNANINKSKLIYGLGTELEKLNEKSNKDLKIELDSTDEKEIQLNFKFDDNNLTLLENIEIIANENSKSTVILKYISTNKEKAFHNGIIRVKAKKNSEIKIIIVNLINEESNNFISIENNIEENAKCKYIMVDFGGKNSITNYYSNLIGESSENIINTIYLGKENQLLDLNYIGELRGKKSNIDIDVLSQKNEAKAGFYGAYTSGICCTIDIGGASTEIAVGDSSKIYYTKSLPIGVVRLRDICGEDMIQLDAYTQGVITEYGDIPKADKVYAIGGTASTIVAVLEEMEVYNPAIVHGYKLTKLGILRVYNKICSVPLERREEIKGLTKNRADIICGGAILLINIMNMLKIDFVEVSEKDNLEGYLKVCAKKALKRKEKSL